MKKLLIAAVVIVIVIAGAVGTMVASDLSQLRTDVADINSGLSNLENALQGSPSLGTRELVRRRIDQIRDDLRKLSLRHQWAMTFFRKETDSVWNRFGELERRSRQ